MRTKSFADLVFSAPLRQMFAALAGLVVMASLAAAPLPPDQTRHAEEAGGVRLRPQKPTPTGIAPAEAPRPGIPIGEERLKQLKKLPAPR